MLRSSTRGAAPLRNLTDNLRKQIGDSKHDIHAAHDTGCEAYCVPYGYNEGEPVKAEDCDALVGDLGGALLIARKG